MLGKPTNTAFVEMQNLSTSKKSAKRKLVCIKMQERAIPRSGYPIYVKGLHVGNVTSGTISPSLSCGIAIGYVNIEHSNLETALHIDIRGKRRSGLIVKPPFYSGGSLML